MSSAFDLFPDIPSRVAAYSSGRDAAADLDAVFDRIGAEGAGPVWISLMPRERAQALLAAASARRANGESLPLFGVPFAVKDNIDVAGLPTTAACPAFAYEPEGSASVVERLVAAGAIPVGKTNLDQFATGLNGTRSPYGIPACAFSDRHVSGGSSSGSAVAVTRGLVPFALGTDTAGSGRVPAAFNNLVGLKPTKGLVSARGVVPACRSQDCVSIFAASVGDALQVLAVAEGFDAADPFSREAEAMDGFDPATMRFGTPGDDVLAACAPGVRAGFEAACRALEGLGASRIVIDYKPFADAAELLYAGPWVAERLEATGDLLAAGPEALHPVVAAILRPGEAYSARDAFAAQSRLAGLLREAAAAWMAADVLVLPSAPEHPTIEAMLADPVGANSRLGLFTNFVNLMDLAALAVPAGFGPSGLPLGVTLVGPAFSDRALAALGDRLHRALPGMTLAATARPLAAARSVPTPLPPEPPRVRVAVVGAHLSGQPLNRQLTERGGRLVATSRTAPGYSLYALAGTSPPKPGLLRDGGRGDIEVEVWSLPAAAYGSFVAEIPAPLGIGTLALADGSSVQGFLCEPYAVAGALDITPLGGWRAYLASLSRAA